MYCFSSYAKDFPRESVFYCKDVGFAPDDFETEIDDILSGNRATRTIDFHGFAIRYCYLSRGHHIIVYAVMPPDIRQCFAFAFGIINSIDVNEEDVHLPILRLVMSRAYEFFSFVQIVPLT